MRDYPPLDSRRREDFLAELERRAAEESGGDRLHPAKGGLLYTLLSLYSDMLADTAGRLNRTPEKHRLAFLNLQQTPRKPSCPGETVAVFEAVEGYDCAVSVPQGSLVAARGGERPVLYRTKWDFDVIPAKLCDIIWSDSEADRAEIVYTRKRDEAQKPFCLWEAGAPTRGRHSVDLLFENVLIDADGNHEVLLEVALTLNGKPLDNAVLTDPARLIWSVHSLPDGGDTMPLWAEVTPRQLEGGCILLSYSGFYCRQPVACLRMELVDALLVGIEIKHFLLRSFEDGISPEAVVAGDRELEGTDFYPFQSPMRALEECFIFCDNALLRPGAEIAVEFDLLLEESVEELPREEQEIDYKWIMKQPKPKPEPKFFEAFARSVRWEYWNGAAYCELCGRNGDAADFTLCADRRRLRFDCPADIACGSAGGHIGYFLRLSSGLCEALYRMPRRVYTPRVQNLNFSYQYRLPVFPVKVTAENFGERQEFSPRESFSPFCPLPQGQRLFLGLDMLPHGAQMRIYCGAESRLYEKQTFLTAWLYGDTPQRLAIDDGTYGLTRSGLISIVSPEKPEQSSFFGRTRYWLCLKTGGRQSPRRVNGLYLNAQQIENRVRHKQYSSFSALGLNCRLQLTEGNIVKAWVYVRAGDGMKWEQWSEYSLGDGDFRENFYILDYRSGMLTFPPELAARGGASNEDFVGVVYDTCDGVRGNVAAGAINRLQGEIPFISAVCNPLPVRSGEDSETDEQLAARAEHRLCHGGQAVSARDFEMIAQELYTCIYRAKCMAGRPVRLVLLLREADEGINFSRLRAGLLSEFSKRGCAGAAGTTVEVIEAVRVPISLHIRLCGRVHVLSVSLEQFKRDLAAFLDPVDGGLRGDGWEIGTLPTHEQLEAFIRAKKPRGLALDKLTVTAGGGDLSKTIPDAFRLPGEVRIELEVVS